MIGVIAILVLKHFVCRGMDAEGRNEDENTHGTGLVLKAMSKLVDTLPSQVQLTLHNSCSFTSSTISLALLSVHLVVMYLTKVGIKTTLRLKIRKIYSKFGMKACWQSNILQIGREAHFIGSVSYHHRHVLLAPKARQVFEDLEHGDWAPNIVGPPLMIPYLRESDTKLTVDSYP